MELEMGLIPKLHLLKRHYSTKSDLFDTHQGSCSHILPFWVLISNENHNLAMMVLAWRMWKVSSLSQPFTRLLLPAVVVPWCLEHARSHRLVPPVSGMPRVTFTSRCHWWSTGRGDTHPGLSQTWPEDLVIFWLHKEHTQTHRQKHPELRDFPFR